jgi:1-deoxy-D-xylulose-5-phosphate reductoisomerase
MLAVGRLDFEPPDMEAFRCLRIARDCIAAGGNAMAICNAANEIAVAAFLDEIIGFRIFPQLSRKLWQRCLPVNPEPG